MAEIIRAYMNEEIMAFEFIDPLDEIRAQTEDRTVQNIFGTLWHCHGDLKNHKIVASKELWDYFHRLLLVLESGADIETTVVRKRSFRQPIAACTLAVFVVLAVCLGWGPHLLVAYITLGLVSMLLSYSRSRAIPRPSAVAIASEPFSCISQVLAAHRRVPHFTKRQYPSHLSKRTIRHWILDTDLPLLSSLVMRMIRLMFAPVLLLFQAMPEVDSRTTVIISQ
jgi:hypothetical protein